MGIITIRKYVCMDGWVDLCLFAYVYVKLTFLLFFFGPQGLAYQLIDDVLDFTGTSASLGKGSLSDIRHVSI